MSDRGVCTPSAPLCFPLSFSFFFPLLSASLLFPPCMSPLSPSLCLLQALRPKGQLIFLPPPWLSQALVHRQGHPYQDCLLGPWKPWLIGKRSHLFFHSLSTPKVLPSQEFHSYASITRETAGVTCHPEGDIQTCCSYLDTWALLMSITAPNSIYTLQHHTQQNAREHLINVLQACFIHVILRKYLMYTSRRSFILREYVIYLLPLCK